MIRKLEMLYPSISLETLALLLNNAEDFCKDYCNLGELPYEMDSLLIAMVQQDISKLYSEGYSAESVSGTSVTYNPDYTPQTYKRLNKYKRIQTVL